MTFHEVSAVGNEGNAINASISVNVWSRSREEEAFEAISGGSVLLPLDEDWNTEVKVAAALTYLSHVLGSTKAWQAWRESRWLHLKDVDQVDHGMFTHRPKSLVEHEQKFRKRAQELRVILSSLVPNEIRSRELLFDFADELATFACGQGQSGDGREVSSCLGAWERKEWN